MSRGWTFIYQTARRYALQNSILYIIRLMIPFTQNNAWTPTLVTFFLYNLARIDIFEVQD